MAELADALVLGTSGYPVQVQVLLSAVNEKSTDYSGAFCFTQVSFCCIVDRKITVHISCDWQDLL